MAVFLSLLPSWLETMRGKAETFDMMKIVNIRRLAFLFICWLFFIGAEHWRTTFTILYLCLLFVIVLVGEIGRSRRLVGGRNTNLLLARSSFRRIDCFLIVQSCEQPLLPRCHSRFSNQLFHFNVCCCCHFLRHWLVTWCSLVFGPIIFFKNKIKNKTIV